MILDHERILEIHAQAVAASLHTKRNQMLFGVSVEYVAGLDLAANPSDQLLSDLAAMNEVGTIKLEDRDRLKQKPQNPLITCTENDYTNAILEPDDYRTPLVSETRTYEICNIKPNAQSSQGAALFTFDELAVTLAQPFDPSQDPPYENIELRGADPAKPCRRLIERMQTRYRPDDFGASRSDASALLDKGVLEPQRLPARLTNLRSLPVCWPRSIVAAAAPRRACCRMMWPA